MHSAEPAILSLAQSDLVQGIAAPVHESRPVYVKAEGESLPPFESPIRNRLGHFNPDNVFKKDLSPSAIARPKDVYLRRLIEKQDPELLDAGVRRAFEDLDSIQGALSQYVTLSPDADYFGKEIEKLRTQAERKPTVVGVGGTTGAGKSSLINAILDEERLMPTNCMRACTAVVTEISWNNSLDPNRKYTATIEFITREDWEKEVRILLKDFRTESGGVAKESSDPNSDGIAWAKFHAVYPEKTKEMLYNCNVADLMNVTSVLDVLGTTKNINKSTAEPFYRELQRYVDSKEKSRGKNKNDKRDRTSVVPEIELWPLIKVVKIQTKSLALSTGAVIVDLPGVHDSNAARDAVAQGYLEQCTRLWIVTPINRAVDDKAAKTLLGDSFKRQLKFDGGLSDVTFICSKTDDISITEATDSLDLENRISVYRDEGRVCNKRLQKLNEEVRGLQVSIKYCEKTISEVDNDVAVGYTLKDGLNRGQTAYAPINKGNKRKRGNLDEISRKRNRPEEDSNDSYTEVTAAPQTPLTEEDIRIKLEKREHARYEISQMTAKRKKLRKDQAVIKSNLANIRLEISAICIAGRNEYSKSAVQQHYAAGIRELDQENAAEDEANFNPDEDLRNYDEVAKSLPVFCVSSRAYQNLCGRLQNDDKVPGFKSAEETEIPQLQAHCMKLTEAGRIQTSLAFLQGFRQLLHTLSLWSSTHGSGSEMKSDEKQKQHQYVRMRLDELQKGLKMPVLGCTTTMEGELREHISDKYPKAVEAAFRNAPIVSRGWGAPKSEGGLAYITYKAIVRHQGAFQSGSAGYKNFNSELIEPILKLLATGWERAFQTRLPEIIQQYTQASIRVLQNFHEEIEKNARQHGELAHLPLLTSLIRNHEQRFRDHNINLIYQMTRLHRDANRQFMPAIANIMIKGYENCDKERGTGAFMRMKDRMNEHVERYRHSMFTTATETVWGHTNQMCRVLKEMMLQNAGEIFENIRRNYLQASGGVPTVHVRNGECAMKDSIKSLLLRVDERFRWIADGNVIDLVNDEQETAAEFGPLEETAINNDENESAVEAAYREDEVFITDDAPSGYRSDTEFDDEMDGEYDEKMDSEYDEEMYDSDEMDEE
ncbi:hypothetical protein K505DRAFT_228631 [Melanomma pulvis-pyrius CBS 109.77]|uniref:P-loop containing nucleoside triphosphate hydrolase protein n=1 Tax=Melanomma pulvis-pyrius CBS 109.77 TaxID=1314802 RepID=A0A6A6XVC5_9PLEO|nr:hypothetical protein K505DRAFT_228631 [Melanomma pulvis-pyrius CBS 109.77]